MSNRFIAFDLDNQRSAQPKHEQLRDYLEKQMVAGNLKPGQKIPSEHDLVESLGLARTTIRQAMASLENEGLIRRVQGKGTFVEIDALRKLHRGQDIFALVVPESRGGFYPSLLHGFEAAAGRVRHQTIICNTDNNVGQQADVVLQLLDKEVGGVAMVPTSQPQTPAYQVRQLQKHGIPVVFCHRRVEGITAPLLAIPFRQVGRLAGQVLAEHGHRRVAFLTTHRSPVTPAWQAGLQEGLREGGCDAAAELACIGESFLLDEENLFASLKKVFSGREPPTALFASFDSIAEMVYLLLPRLGLQTPRDVSLLGFGGAWREGALTRRLSSVVIDEIETGRQAVALLHAMRRGDRPIEDNEEIILKLQLSNGETLAAPAGKSRRKT
jgi:GntR family transcriptional regulator, arabinose operon transcriptional repressor